MCLYLAAVPVTSKPASRSLIQRLLCPLAGYGNYARSGILGMNRRNISYISRYNPRGLFPLVDDKLKTKQLALEHGLRVPSLLAVIESQSQVASLDKRLPIDQGFCIKPAKGSGGKGIMVVTQSEAGGYRKSNGSALSISEIQRHVSNILAGLFSLGGAPDKAVIESLLSLDSSLKDFSHEGVPDLRVIVFRGVPVMAMMRLSCSSSHGKANLHQGAVGVGIDIGTGKAIKAVQRDKAIQYHPDTQHNLHELVVPHWQELLQLSCACYDMTGLGYLGVDLVLDEKNGPTVLELNARPGLSIQIANGQGLLPRLRLVEKLRRPDRMSVSEREAFAINTFSSLNK